MFALGLGVSVGNVIIGACFRKFLANFTRPWAPTQRANFLAQGLCGI